MGLYDNRLSRIGIASLIVAILAPALPASAEDITTDNRVISSYPDATDFRFTGVGALGKLILQPPATGNAVLAGNLALQRDATIEFTQTIENPVLLAGNKTLDLGGNTLTLLSNRSAEGMLNLILGSTTGFGTFAAGTTGAIQCRGPDPSDPQDQETIIHLNGGTSNNNGSNVTFDLWGGGLSIDAIESLPQTTTFIAKYGSSVILPTNGTIGGGSTQFTYQVDSDSGNYTNIGGMFLLGDNADPNNPISRDITYAGDITYSADMNYIDSSGASWGAASLIVGSGTLTVADDPFRYTNALAIGGGRNFLTGVPDSNVFATLIVSSLADLPENIGFCGGKLNVVAAGAAIDLRNYSLAAITIDTGDGEPYPGGGALVVDGTQDVTVTVSATRLLTRDGILHIEQQGSGGSLTVVVDCEGGIVDPDDFAGFDLPSGATVQFTRAAGDTVAAGNIEGGGTFDAGNKNLSVGSNVDATLFQGTIQNVVTLQKTGAGKTQIGSGASVTVGSAQVGEGELSVQAGSTFNVGSGTGTVTVEGTGRLSGNGTVQGNVSLGSGGWLAPGNSIGVHSTTGNVTIQSGGGVEVEVRSLAPAQTVGVPGADNDVEIVDGQVQIQNGGTIHVTEDSTSAGNFKAGDRYYAVVASGGINNVEGLNVTNNLSGFTVTNYGIQQTTVGVTGYGDVSGSWFWFELTRGFQAETANESAMADYLLALHDASQATTLYNAVDGLSSQAQPAALGVLSGESLVTSQSLAITSMTVSSQVLFNQIRATDPCATARAMSGSPWDGWATGYGVGGRLHGDGNTTATGISSGGLIVGIERCIGYRAKGGLFYNFDHVSGDNNARYAATRIDGHLFGGYLQEQRDGWYWLTAGGFGFDQFESQRRVTIGALNETPRAEYDGWRSMVYGEAGLDYQIGMTMIRPYGGLQYAYFRQHALTETDAANTGLSVAPAEFDCLRTHMGGRISRLLDADGARAIEFRSAWIHEMLDATGPRASARFTQATGGASFLVDGTDLGRDWWWLGTGVRWTLASNSQLYLDYDLMINARQSVHTGSGGITMTW